MSFEQQESTINTQTWIHCNVKKRPPVTMTTGAKTIIDTAHIHYHDTKQCGCLHSGSHRSCPHDSLHPDSGHPSLNPSGPNMMTGSCFFPSHLHQNLSSMFITPGFGCNKPAIPTAVAIEQIIQVQAAAMQPRVSEKMKKSTAGNTHTYTQRFSNGLTKYAAI